MNNTNRLGCLTPTGFITALITLLVLAVSAFTNGSHMFNAGALNSQPGESIGGVTSHAEIAECRACHTAPWERAIMADRCIECHKDVAAQALDVTQLHGSIIQKSPNLACRDCHREHRGATASLTDFDKNLFPHETFGFSLNKHTKMDSGTPITCEDCHADDIKTFASDSCQTCHSDMDIAYAQAHLLAFGSDCLACHDGIDRFSAFDHNAYAFKLEGKHIETTCTDCHLDARSLLSLQSAPQDCFSCHQQDDAHAGAYGNDCQICHSSTAWEPANFDHNLSAFKLDGKHVDVACEQCHVNEVYKGTPQDCYSCHKQDDEHNGQYGTQCETCHNAADWKNATFDHNLSSFQLSGAHVNTSCESCHVNNVFKGTSKECVACHADPQEHAGQFGTDCVACHTTSAWLPASFNGDHTFPIYHGDGNGSCQTCHPSQLTTYTCYGCHEHTETKIASKHRKEGISNFQNCVECHISGNKHDGDGGDHDDDD